MVNLDSKSLQLLKLLTDGFCHSKSILMTKLELGYDDFYNVFKQLKLLGIPIIEVNNQHYQLQQALVLLNKKTIQAAINTCCPNFSFHLHLYHSINSTNSFLKTLPFNDNVDICCSEAQTQGRGRFNRVWFSPFGENIYCSSRWILPNNPQILSVLSIVTSLAVLSSLNNLNLPSEIKVKWPNDIYADNKKLSGGLVEINSLNSQHVQVIIGIGLNVNSSTTLHCLTDTNWCSLFDISNTYYDRNLLIALIISNLKNYLDLLVQNGFEFFIKQWNHADYLAGKMIMVHQIDRVLEGTACGITTRGQLIIKDKEQFIHYISAGDASLKKL